MSTRERTAAASKLGRRMRSYELSDEAASLIEQARLALQSAGTVPRCSKVQALEMLIQEGFASIKKKS